MKLRMRVHTSIIDLGNPSLVPRPFREHIRMIGEEVGGEGRVWGITIPSRGSWNAISKLVAAVCRLRRLRKYDDIN